MVTGCYPKQATGCPQVDGLGADQHDGVDVWLESGEGVEEHPPWLDVLDAWLTRLVHGSADPSVSEGARRSGVRSRIHSSNASPSAVAGR